MTRKEYLERTIDFDDAIIRIVRLEKENAELKKKCQSRCDECWEEHIKLTKAKEIIKDLLLVADNNISQMGFQLCVADAKQFLNSEVEK